MGIRKFFHKIKMFFVRAREYSLPDVDEAKCYGNDGEDAFTYMLRRELPSCRIKRNVIISTAEGNAEIDCLVCYENKRCMGAFNENSIYSVSNSKLSFLSNCLITKAYVPKASPLIDL